MTSYLLCSLAQLCHGFGHGAHVAALAQVSTGVERIRKPLNENAVETGATEGQVPRLACHTELTDRLVLAKLHSTAEPQTRDSSPFQGKQSDANTLRL